MLTERDAILIADFVNTTGDPAFDGTLKQALAVQLGQSPYFNIFPDERVRDTLQYMERSPDERVTDALALEICQREGIKAVLGGSITALGTQYVLLLNAAQCGTGESIAREQREADAKEQVLTELGRAASSLRAKLGESLASIQKFDTPIERATTSSLEALGAFTQARRLHAAGTFALAVPLLQRAVELDPNFAMGYYLLGVVHGSMGQAEPSRENRTKAFELRDRGSEMERLTISAAYYSRVLRDLGKGIETLELLKQTYPRDPPARMGLGAAYRDVGRHEDSLAEYQEGVRLSRGGPFYVGEVGATYMRLNRLEEAKAVIKTAIEQKVETPRMHAILYQIAFIEGDAQAAQREFELSRPTAAARVANQAETAAFNGRLRDVRKLLRQTANSPQSGTTDRLGAAVNLASLASFEALFGNETEARRDVRDALRLSPLEPAAAPI